MATYTMTPGGESFSVRYKLNKNFPAGNYSYFSGANTSGTKDNPIVCNFAAGVIFSNGINLTNCSYWKFDGSDNKNLLILNASGVALSFKGKCNGIAIKGAKVQNPFSYIWFKTEVADFNTWDYFTKNADGTIQASFVMDDLTLTNCEFSGAKFDGGYIGSTGQNADRAVKMVDGNTYYPLPAKVSNIKIDNITINGAARTGLQISGLLEGTNYLKNSSISNCGQSLEAYQGASFLIGGNSPGGIEIDNNTFDGSNLYSVRTDGGGVIKFTNNTVVNATEVNGKANTQPMAAVQFDSYENTPLTLIITKSLSADSVFEDNILEGQFQNFTGVDFKKNNTPPPVQPLPTPDPPIPVPDPKPVDTSIVSIGFIKGTGQAVFNRADGTNTTIQKAKSASMDRNGVCWYILNTNDKSKHTVK